MNRKLLVSLLRKNIEELEMITEGFMEMNEYPKVILQLATRKTEDIQSIIEQLSEIKPLQTIASSPVSEATSNLLPETEKTIEKTEPLVENNIPQPEPALQSEAESVTAVLPQTEPVVLPVPEPEVAPEPVPAPVPSDEPSDEPKSLKVIELDETIELLNEIEITDVFAEDEGMKTIELDDLEDITENIKSESSVITEISEPETKPAPVPEPSPEIPPTRKESRVEELLIKTTSEETKIVTLADKIAPSKISRSEKLSQADNSLSASIANKRIDDIKQAISIGDRFRFQRELFGGNGEDMNKTLNYINQLATLEEVLSFLQNKYKWVEDDNDVVDFMQIVKRRFS